MSSRTILALDEINNFTSEFPNLPDDYIEYLLNTGWGETESGRMIYQGPIDPKEVYGPDNSLKNIVLLGDDFQGYCLGFDLSNLVYGEATDLGEWEAWEKNEKIESYV